MSKLNQITTCNALQWEDAQKLVDHLMASQKYKYALLAQSGFMLGLRISDLLSLTWRNLLNVSELIVREKKTKKIRKIYINQKLQDLVKVVYERLKIENDGVIELDKPIFLNRFGTKPISISYVDRMLPKYLNQINIKCVRAGSHTFRKSFGKRLYDAGNQTEHSLIMLSELLHHSSVSSTRQYIGLNQESFRQAFQSL